MTGAVTGWKDLVTVELPVGSYRNLLVPALVVFLVGTLIALRLAWLPARVAVLASVVSLGMVFFGLAFGRHRHQCTPGDRAHHRAGAR